MKITGAIFDMDGTLVDSLGFWDILWEKLGEKYLGDKSFRPDEKTEKAVRTSTLYDASAIIHQSCGIGESEESLFKVVDGLLKWHYEENVKMKDGALDFLEYLLKKGIKMCVATATAPQAHAAIMMIVVVLIPPDFFAPPSDLPQTLHFLTPPLSTMS